MSERRVALQDLVGRNHCFGCGPLNEGGLHIKSYWEGEETVCTWLPHPEHMAGPTHILNGGIIATIIDCHSICTAIADAYLREGKPIDSKLSLWYATAQLDIQYLRPVAIAHPVTLRARVVKVEGRKTTVSCSLYSQGKECARGEVLAVRVPEEWRMAS